MCLKQQKNQRFNDAVIQIPTTTACFVSQFLFVCIFIAIDKFSVTEWFIRQRVLFPFFFKSSHLTTIRALATYISKRIQILIFMILLCSCLCIWSSVLIFHCVLVQFHLCFGCLTHSHNYVSVNFLYIDKNPFRQFYVSQIFFKRLLIVLTYRRMQPL